MIAAEHLDADLMELSHAPLLRPRVAEHRTDVVEPLQPGSALHLVLDEGPGDGRRVLGAERQGSPLAIRKGVHFLGHDVAACADAAREQLGALEDRRPNLLEAVALEDLAGALLHELPAPDLVWQNVPRSLRGLDHRPRAPGARPPVRTRSGFGNARRARSFAKGRAE